MSDVQYPFIDVAVHERVSEAFAAGKSVVLFAPDLRSACWANGRGAALFGFNSIYDFLDQGPDRSELMFRQVEPVARSLQAVGDRRSFTIRIVSGFSRVAVQASCEMIRFQGRSCVLLTVAANDQRLSLSERATRLIEGFDDPETHMAVLDSDGTILAASGEFAALEISIQTNRMLVSMVGNDRNRLVKRPISTANGYLPAAVGKVSEDPALHLLFVVDIARGRNVVAAPEAAMPEAAADVIETEAPEAFAHVDDDVSHQAEYEEALNAVAAIEDNPETEEEISLDGTEADELNNLDENTAGVEEAEGDISAPMPEDTEQLTEETSDATSAETIEPIEAAAEEADPLPVIEAAPADEVFADETASAGEAAPETVEAEEPPVVSVPRAVTREVRTVRFVWKIDATGHFSEISKEFAEAVGSHAADISGMAFSDLAALFNLDPDGKIGELLSRRDTWSGKTIWWPVEGTSLVVPVDLAALPTYTRMREFDGFRGFGIVRLADAAEDPHASGLSLGAGLGEDTVAAAMAASSEAEEPAQTNEQTRDVIDPEHDLSAEEQTTENISASDDLTPAAEDAKPEGSDAAAETSLPASEGEWPEGEKPALRLVRNPGNRHSDKIIRLEERRSRLSPGEQAAFQEIARQLDTYAKSAEDTETPDAETTGTDSPAEAEPSHADAVASVIMEDQNGLTAQMEAGEIELPSPAGEDEILAVDESVSEEDDLSPAADHDDELADDQPSGQADDQSGDDDIATAEFDQAQEDDAQDEVDESPEPAYADAPAVGQMLSGRDRIGLNAEIVDQMPVALLVHAGDILIHANAEFLKLTGYSSLEALSDIGGLDALLQRQELEGKTSEAGGMVVVRADDIIIPVTARLQSIRWNETAALMLALMPVASAAQAEEIEEEASDVVPLRPIRAADQLAKLQVEVEELRAILETATDGVVIIGADGDVRSINRSASALFNFDSEEITGEPFVTLFAHESQRAVIDYLNGLSGHGVASVLNDGREVIGREASGGFLPLFMTIGRLTSSNGYCAVIRDITQWKRTEDELRTAKRAAETANAHKSEFLAHVSHEIRTPLNAIIGFADMMASERLGPVGHSRYVEYANDIGRSGRHVLDIVNDLLDISKIEAGELDLDFVAVGLNETVSEAVSLVQPQANGQRVIIRTALSQAVPQVVADLRSVKQIVLNILSNAIRFTPSGGQIVVSTGYEANGSVVLRIRDTGIGMSRAELELAMKPFRQVPGGSRNRGDGTGLGLPLTKAMVDANRATFNITSAPNEGTLVEVTFPSQRVLAS